MPASDIEFLLQNFPPQTSQHRAALIEFARTSSLVYGQWKHFKKFFKLAEAPALSGEETDVELLGALLGRIDAAPIPSHRQAKLKCLSDEKKSGLPEIVKPKTIRHANAIYSVGGRNSEYDSSGWRLEISSVATAPNSGGLRGALETVKSVFAPKAGENKRLYDFNAHDYIGYQRKIAFKNGLLEIECNNWNSTKTFQINVADPEFAFLVNSGPSAATWQYMKRRARRLMRKLSTQRPQLYRQLLQATLHETAATAKSKSLEPATQWLAMDALYARSTRWQQTPAARGPYQLIERKFQFRNREERAPEIWDAHLDWTREIFLNEKIPTAANAVALRVLRANQQDIPALNTDLLLRFLDSNEPVLQSYATRKLAASKDLQNQPPKILAAALLLSGAPTRRRLQEILQAALADPSTPDAWRVAFAKQLASALETKSARRARVAARLLAASFSDHVSDKVVFNYLEFFLEQSGENNDWIFARIRARGEKGDLKFLDVIAYLPTQFRERVLQEFSHSARNSTPQAKDVIALIKKEDAKCNRIGWRFLEATAMEAKQIQELWKSFSRWSTSNKVYAAAFNEVASANLWQRANWKQEDAKSLIDSRAQTWSEHAHFFSSEFLDAVLGSLPPEEKPHRIFLWIARLQPQIAQQILQSHLHKAENYAPTAEDIRAAFTHVFYSWNGPSSALNIEPTWQFLAASAATPETLREVWRELWGHAAPAAAFGDVAADVLRHAEIPAEEIADWIQSAPPVHAFSPRFFLLVVELAPPAQKVELLLRPSDEQWQNLRGEVFALLQNNEGLRVGFWNSAWQGLENSPQLLARFDGELTANFNTLSVAAFNSLLPSATDAHEILAASWLQTHADELMRDENLEILILTATHAVDTIRLWGMRRLRERGLSVAIALRLMESGLPQPFALGREYFESAERESSREKDYALALCDSPNREVQQYGREYLLRRASTLLDAAVLQNLAEHPDSQMQSWVAEHLLQTSGIQTREFDTTVLRARGKARNAKEKVKKRIGSATPSTPAVATSALLELARGSAPRDREWALQQLAKRALGGEEIPGVAFQNSAEK